MSFNYCRKIQVNKTRHRLRKVRDKALPRHSVYVYRRRTDVLNLAYLIAIHGIGQIERCIFVHRKV